MSHLAALANPERKSPYRTPAARAAHARACHRNKAIAAYADILPIIAKLRSEGRSLKGIASILNGQGRLTRNGKPFISATVGRILDRAANVPAE